MFIFLENVKISGYISLSQSSPPRPAPILGIAKEVIPNYS